LVQGKHRIENRVAVEVPEVRRLPEDRQIGRAAICLLQLAASSFRRERQGGGYEACSGEAKLTDAS